MTVKKNTTVKKTATKKETAPVAEKTSTKANDFKKDIILQYGDKSVSYDEILQNAKNVWAYDLNNKVSDIKSMELYIKPEEDRVYYVINDKEAGSFIL